MQSTRHLTGFLVLIQIYIWQLKDEDLIGVAFIDTQIYVHSIITIKNLILIGDIAKSISLLRYQEDMKVLSLVSRVRCSCPAIFLGEMPFAYCLLL